MGRPAAVPGVHRCTSAGGWPLHVGDQYIASQQKCGLWKSTLRNRRAARPGAPDATVLRSSATLQRVPPFSKEGQGHPMPGAAGMSACACGTSRAAPAWIRQAGGAFIKFERCLAEAQALQPDLQGRQDRHPLKRCIRTISAPFYRGGIHAMAVWPEASDGNGPPSGEAGA